MCVHCADASHVAATVDDEAIPQTAVATADADADEEPEECCSECDMPEGECNCWECECGRSHTCTEDTDRCSSCDFCMDHCECSSCSNCDARGDFGTCEHCDRCDECCNCSRCGECGEYDGDDHCSSCGNCAEHCECSRPVDLFKSPLRFHTASRKQFKRNPSKRHIGCELEIAEAAADNGISSSVRKWKGSIVEDGSLPDSGFEIVTAPANGDVFCEQIEEICDKLDRSEATVTSACGYHVHIDARDFRYFEIRKLIILYRKIEDALFGMVPRSRRSNSMCKPCAGDYYDSLQGGKECKSSIVRTIYKTVSRNVADRRKQKYDGARYQALNLHSWFFRGTVECRLAAGTCSADKVICWGMMWASILDYVYSVSEKTVTALADDDSKSSLEVLLSLAATDEVRAFIKERTKKFA